MRNLGVCRESPYQPLLPQAPTVSVVVTEASYDKIEFPGFKLFEQACSDTDFEFDSNVRILTAETPQDPGQPTIGQIFTCTNSQSTGVACAR
jgi:hypothetical protein